MKNPFKRDVPAGAAVVIVALALLASVVTGREQATGPEIVAATASRAVSLPVAAEELDLTKLARERKERPGQDLFSGAAPPIPVAPPAPAIQPIAAPTTPPLPYSYLGHMKNGDRTIVYLLKNQELFLVEAGQALDGSYQVESITESVLTFVYTPLGTKQLLAIPPRPQ